MLGTLTRWLNPRDGHFFESLEEQAQTAHTAAVALARFTDASSVASVREEVQALEHAGDKLAHEMEESLARTFVTPIDREDLHKLSQQLDDVLDFANAAIRCAELYGLRTPTPPMTKLMALLAECTGTLKTALPLLRKHDYAGLAVATKSLRALEKQGDTIYRDAVSTLFHDPSVDAMTLFREKEVLEVLESAVDACETVGETLAYVGVKHE